jgi:hypothetical protein
VVDASDVYGQKKGELINSAKIALNLHYYIDANLETSRLNEIINYNKIIVSEDIPPEDFYAKELYKNFVIYVEPIKENLSNIDQLYTTIDKALLTSDDPDKFTAYKHVLENKTKYLFIKSLIDIIYLYIIDKKLED